MTLDGPVRTQRRFTYHMMTSAVENAISAQEIEEDFLEDDSNECGTVHDSYVIQSVIAAYSALEANINEFLELVEIEEFDLDEDVEDRILELSEAHPSDFRRKNPGEKYQLVLLVTDSDVFDKGSEPWQSMDLVRRIRNYFVHYDPETIEVSQDGSPNTSIGKSLETKDFRLNPAWEDEQAPLFPHKALSYGLAKWAVESSIEFMEEFYDRLGVDPHYPDMREELTPKLDSVDEGFE